MKGMQFLQSKFFLIVINKRVKIFASEFVRNPKNNPIEVNNMHEHEK